MEKIAVAADSNSGITQKEAKELGVYVMPMPFYINDEMFLEDVTLTQEEFYERLKEDVEIKTSAPIAGDLIDFFDEILKEYDKIVYIPMTSGMSSSYSVAKSLEQDYEGKLIVVDNQRVTVTQRQSVVDAKNMVDAGMPAQEIHDKLMENAHDSSFYITLDTLYYLRKGGRLTPAAAAFGTLLHVKPVLQFQGANLDSFARARTIAQAKTIMINQVKKDCRERFGSEDGSGVHIAISYTKDLAAAEAFKKEVLAAFPRDPDEIVVQPLSLNASCHAGPGSLLLAGTKAITIE